MRDFAKRTRSLSLEDLREDYRLAEFTEENCQTNPIDQFQQWFEEAQNAESRAPNAMSLATATPDGRPSNRIVLLKEVSEQGFIFYTNYTSRKGRELSSNPICALTFYWPELERQVRVEGTAEQVSPEKSGAYFRRRPKGSRLGAWVSQQSEVLPNRKPLEEKLAVLEARYAGTDDVPPPEFWGGYRVIPEEIEFWQGRTNRLHDRIRYRRNDEGAWIIERLSP